MKKIALMSLISLATVSAQAFSLATQIPQDKVRSYKKAVLMAIRSQGLDNGRCKATLGTLYVTDIVGEGNILLDLITTATGIDLTDGGQPLLAFTELGSYETTYTYITTSPDFSKIFSIKVINSRSSTTDVNKGNLKNPDIEWVTSWQPQAIIDCK